MTASLLKDWDNFYVITGSSAAGLTGLTFVVIALAADAKRVSPNGVRAYIEPIVVHLSAVLALAAYLSMPHQGVLSLSLGLGAAAVAGLLYAAGTAVRIRGVSSNYVPVREDWIWHVIVPGAAYSLLLASALCLWRWPEESMYGVAAVSVCLMFAGIHNAWDVAVSISVRNAGDGDGDGERSAVTAQSMGAAQSVGATQSAGSARGTGADAAQNAGQATPIADNSRSD